MNFNKSIMSPDSIQYRNEMDGWIDRIPISISHVSIAVLTHDKVVSDAMATQEISHSMK